MRISITALVATLLITTGCSTVKTAYNGQEGSHFTNPAKMTAMNNSQTSQNGLAPIAEGPSADVAESSKGWTGTGTNHLTGVSTQPQFTPAASTASNGSWGGALSTR